jgi:hypothetical protein
MSKYDPLTTFLAAKAGREIRLSFAEIEQIVGQRLPEKSKTHRPWWSNNPNNNVMTKAWLAAGYKTAQVDIAAEMLTFVADEQSKGFEEMEQAKLIGAGKRHPLFGSMKGTSIIASGVDLTEPADPSWAKVYDDDHDHGVIVERQDGRHQ